MNLEQEIQDLLYRNNCVIIPEFGAFISSQLSSQLIDNQSFTPPRKQISFNSKIVNNDGLLINYVAQTKEISYNEAKDLVKEVVENWQDKLNLIKKLYLKNIGNFSVSESGILLFSEDNHFNYLTSSFGLSNFVSPSIERENTTSQVIDITKKEEIKIQKYLPIVKEKKRNSFWRVASIILLFLTVSAFISIVYYNSTINNQREIVEQKVNQKINQKISEATFAIPVLPFKNFNQNTNSNQYFVVAGSFSSEKNANKLNAELKLQGFSSTIIERENKMFTVTFQSFNTEIEAENFRKNIQKTSNPDAWVLQVNQ